MREIRSSGSVEGVVRDHDPYSNFCLLGLLVERPMLFSGAARVNFQNS
jgi:hypothetical protein